MEALDSNLVLHWLNHTTQLAQRICVVVVAAFVSIRLDWLRRALRGASAGRTFPLVAIAYFALLAIAGTHSGFVLDIAKHGRVTAVDFSGSSMTLKSSQAIVGFRDTMTLVAGLVGGPWVGLGTGLLAGAERWSLGGFVGLASGISTLLLGLGAGCIRHFRPHWATALPGALAVALGGTLLQRVVILLMAPDDLRTSALAVEIAVPVAVVNGMGCVLFLWIMRDLDHERLARLRSWQAQIDPHFLNNTLSNIETLIGLDPAKASAYVVKLARFFDETRNCANVDAIPLEQELQQLRRYLDFQKLRFGDELIYTESIDRSPELRTCPVPPRSLQTLAENALTHGFQGHSRPLELHVAGQTRGGNVVLRVSDNGCGMTPERCHVLGTRPVVSASRCGSGTALYVLTQTLELTYGQRAQLRFESRPGAGTEAIMILPRGKFTWKESYGPSSSTTNTSTGKDSRTSYAVKPSSWLARPTAPPPHGNSSWP